MAHPLPASAGALIARVHTARGDCPKTQRARDCSRARCASPSGSQKFVEGIAGFGFELVTIGGFLAADAILGPRRRIQPLRLNLFFAMQARPVGRSEEHT